MTEEDKARTGPLPPAFQTGVFSFGQQCGRESVSRGRICSSCCAATHRQKMQIEVAISSSHNKLTPDQPVLVVSLCRQASVTVASRAATFKSLARIKQRRLGVSLNPPLSKYASYYSAAKAVYIYGHICAGKCTTRRNRGFLHRSNLTKIDCG